MCENCSLDPFFSAASLTIIFCIASPPRWPLAVMDCLFCTGASVAFVASFYTWKRERRFLYWAVRSLRTATADPTIYVDRDSDETIRRRTLSFLLNCALSGSYLAVQSSLDTRPQHTVEQLRIVGRVAVSTLVLFTGPIFDKIVVADFAIEASWLRCWRTYVLCPIGEELFYRGVLFTLLRRRCSSVQIAVAALLFAVSHTHHVVSWACDEYIERTSEASRSEADGDRTDAGVQSACWRAAARRVAFVYVFTGVFGALSGYYYLHICEGSISAIALAHAICNFIAAPELIILRSRVSRPLMKVASAVAYLSGIAGWMWMLLH